MNTLPTRQSSVRVCCDEYDSKRLYAIHILPDELAEDRVSRESISNGLIMCYEHAQEYLHKRFYFNSAGRIENLSSSLVHRNMRLSQRVLSDERISYLRKYNNKKPIRFQFMIAYGGITLKLFYWTMKLFSYNETNLGHNEIILLCPTAQKPCATGIFDKKKRTKVAIPMVS